MVTNKNVESIIKQASESNSNHESINVLKKGYEMIEQEICSTVNNIKEEFILRKYQLSLVLEEIEYFNR